MVTTIALREVLAAMQRVDEHKQPIPFTVTFVKADRVRKTGGELVKLENATLTWTNKKVPHHAKGITKKKSTGNSPDHWKNSTRNVLLPNGQIRKLHIRLIVEFNGKIVHY